MVSEGFVTLELETQGKNKGTNVRRINKRTIPFTGFEYVLNGPVIPKKGQSSGSVHSEVTFTTEWDANTPILFQAICNNEWIKRAVFSFRRHNKKGEEEVYYTITLANGTFSGMTQSTGELLPDDTSKHPQVDTREVMEVRCAFDGPVQERRIGRTAVPDIWTT